MKKPIRRWLILVALVGMGVALLGGKITPSWQFPPGPILFQAGTAGAPSVSTTADTDTGLFWPVANTLAISLGGAELARFHVGGFMAFVNNSFDIGTSAGSRFRHLHLTGGLTLNASMTFQTDNASDLGTSATAGRPRDLFVARDAHITGFFHIQGALTYGAHMVVIASNGVGALGNVEILSGLRSLYLVECLDGDGCTVQLGETNISVGQLIRIVNISTSGSANHNLTLSDAAPLHLAGALTLAANGAVTLIYGVNRSGDGNFYELSRSAN